MTRLERDSQVQPESANGTVISAQPGDVSHPVRPVFYDETQRRRFWFFGMSTLFSTVACFVLAGFIVSVRTPPAFAFAANQPTLGAGLASDENLPQPPSPEIEGVLVADAASKRQQF